MNFQEQKLSFLPPNPTPTAPQILRQLEGVRKRRKLQKNGQRGEDIHVCSGSTPSRLGGRGPAARLPEGLLLIHRAGPDAPQIPHRVGKPKAGIPINMTFQKQEVKPCHVDKEPAGPAPPAPAPPAPNSLSSFSCPETTCTRCLLSPAADSLWSPQCLLSPLTSRPGRFVTK